jgi:23S rRNA (guanine1835-N2)-methyltransferase
MNTQTFKFQNLTLSLQRMPTQHHPSLRAWDAADEYQLTEMSKRSAPNEQITIVNDAFGVLTIALTDQLLCSWNDSFLYQKALKNNLTLNDIDHSDIEQKIQLASSPPTGDPDLVLMKIPKSIELLKYQLITLNQTLSPGTELWLAGMDKHLTKAQFELVEKHYGHSIHLPGRKKARIWKAVSNGLPESYKQPDGYQCPEYSLTLTNRANVFSGSRLDIGSRFLMDNFSKLPSMNKVADCGCGNGLLGLCYLREHPESTLDFFDESSMAIDCTRANLAQHFPEASRWTVNHSDSLWSAESDSYELVLCNPPFHQGNTVETDTANDMFYSIRQALKNTGEAWIVANRHLNYDKLLKNLFPTVKRINQNSKFIIYQAKKSSD